MKIEFDTPVSTYVEQIMKLKSTPRILEELITGIPDKILSKKPKTGWSIKETAGHLLSADNMFIDGLDDYENRLEELRQADMTNQETEEMDYNTLDMGEMFKKFKKRRNVYIGRLAKHQPEFFRITAWHPRLEKPMRICDMLFFQAEHDEHHLNRIRELKTIFNADN
jgi:uncharacterized damage-inducible protein DinB